MTRSDRLFGRVLIAQQVHGRHVEDRADVVEPGRDVVVRQQVLHLHRRGQQVAERGFVFGPVQPPEYDAPLAALPGQRGLVQLPLQPGEDRLGLLFGRPFRCPSAASRRATPGRAPSPRSRRPPCRRRSPAVDPGAACFLDLGTVTADAMSPDKGAEPRLKDLRIGGGGRGCRQEREARPKGDGQRAWSWIG